MVLALQAPIQVHAQDNGSSPTSRYPNKGAEDQRFTDNTVSTPTPLPFWVQFQNLSEIVQPKSEERYSDETNSRSEQKNWYDRFILDHVTDWLLVLFNGMLVSYTYKLHKSTAGLWSAAKIQGDDMKQSIAANKSAADAALRATAAAESQIRLSRETFVLDQRPWLDLQISCDGVEFNSQKHLVFDLHIVIENVGKAPAEHVIFNLPYHHIGSHHLEERFSMIRQIMYNPLSVNNNMTIFSGKTIRFDRKIIINDAEIELTYTQDGARNAHLLFACKYGYTSSNQVYETSKMYAFGVGDTAFPLPRHQVTPGPIALDIIKEFVT